MGLWDLRDFGIWRLVSCLSLELWTVQSIEQPSCGWAVWKKGGLKLPEAPLKLWFEHGEARGLSPRPSSSHLSGLMPSSTFAGWRVCTFWIGSRKPFAGSHHPPALKSRPFCGLMAGLRGQAARPPLPSGFPERRPKSPQSHASKPMKPGA